MNVEGSSKAMPLDPEPVDHGNVVRLRFRPPTDPRAAEVVLVRVLSAGDVVEPHVPRYVSHFVTCPDAQAHRRRGRL